MGRSGQVALATNINDIQPAGFQGSVITISNNNNYRARIV